MRILAILASGAAVLALSACQHSGESVADVVAPTHHANLVGTAEVPGPGDPDGSGKAEVSVVDATDNVCYEIKDVMNLGTITAAHIHRAPVGVAGPPVVTIEAPVDGHSKGCVRVDGALVDDIHHRKSEFYVNIHTVDFPEGAIRGQLAD